MATASEFLSYRGDPALGFGANGDVPVSNPDELGFANQNLRDIALQDHQNQIIKYKQAIDDRDKMYEALQQGTIKVPDILDSDRTVVNNALDKQTQAYTDWMKKGYGNLDGAAAYKKATQAASEAVTQAAARKLFFDKENNDISKEPLPKFQQARKDNLNKNLSNFWGDLVPYEPAARLDMGRVDKYVTPFTTEIDDDKNHPLEKGTRSYFSYRDALKNANTDFLTPDGSYNLQQLHDTLQGMDPMDLYNKIKGVNQELNRYNVERGLNPGDPDYASPIQGVPQYDQNKNLSGLALNEPVGALAAKMALAGQQKYQSDSWALDKTKEAEAKLNIEKQKADSDAIYKRAMAGAAGTKARAYAAHIAQQLSLRKTQADKDQLLDELWNRNLTQQESLIQGRGNNLVNFAPIKADNSLPVYTIKDNKATQLMPIGAEPVWSQYKDPSDHSKGPATGAKVLYYKGGHYDQEYVLDGSPVDLPRVNDIYKNFKKVAGKSWAGSFDDFLKQGIKSGRFKVRLRGANGTTDEDMSRAAQQLISNKGTDKGETGVFSQPDNPPVDETIIEENRTSNREDNQ